MDIQQAIDAPRVFLCGRGRRGGARRAGSDGRRMQSRGHNVVLHPLPHGGGQGIEIDWENGNLTGGSDPRKDGCAIGY
jgi:gamma-glutamyltranspeptidase/glutathione hydrolase